MNSKEPRDYWNDDDQIFCHYGKGYAITPTLKTVCIGTESEALQAPSLGKSPGGKTPAEEEKATTAGREKPCNIPTSKVEQGKSGLRFEIKCIEEVIRLKGSKGKITSFERELLRAYIEELDTRIQPEKSKHGKLHKYPSLAPQSKIGALKHQRRPQGFR